MVLERIEFGAFTLIVQTHNSGACEDTTSMNLSVTGSDLHAMCLIISPTENKRNVSVFLYKVTGTLTVDMPEESLRESHVALNRVLASYNE